MKYFLCICRGKLYKVFRFIFYFVFTLVNVINFVLQGKRYFSFWLFLVSQSYDQNTKQDTLPCVRVRSQWKIKFTLLSCFQKVFSPPQIRRNRSQIQEQQVLMKKKKKPTRMYNAPNGETRELCLHDLLFQWCY